MPNPLAQIAASLRRSAAAAEKKKMSNAKKLAKMIKGMGMEFTITPDLSITSISPSAVPTPEKPNEWDEVLK